MSLSSEQTRIVRDIDSYLRGKHDEDKKFIANSCKHAVPLTLTYRELQAALTAFRAELLRLVGRKNANRWFSHRAGAFDTALRNALERCAAPAANETKLADTLSRPRRDVTVADWNRHGGGRAFSVNGQGFAIDQPTIDQIARFLRANGVTRQPLIDYLCDFANQDGLHAIGHLFSLVLRDTSDHMPSTSGSRHTIESLSDERGVRVRDEVTYNALISPHGGAVTVMPDFKFVQRCELILDGRAVHITNVTYTIEDTDGLTQALREKAEEATTRIATTVL